MQAYCFRFYFLFVTVFILTGMVVWDTDEGVTVDLAMEDDLLVES